MSPQQGAFEAYPREITGLSVSAYQTYPVELANGWAMSSKRRVEVKAAVNTETGEVRFYVDPADVVKLLPKRTEEPRS